jgi:SAM-dependent methyltransferase
MLYTIVNKIKKNGIKGSIKIVCKKVRNKLGLRKNTVIKNYKIIKKAVCGKNGLEIGGPSAVFNKDNYIPIYHQIKSLDGVNFSNETVWTGRVKTENGFYVNGKLICNGVGGAGGHLYISDAVDLSAVPNNAYNFVLSSNNIEHIANPMKALEKWLLKLKPNGVILIIAPRKESNFDHNRNVTPFSHILEDYQKDIGEDDLTHLDEILLLHDLSMDAPAGTPEQFKKRSLANLENRCLHQHVFDMNLLESMFNYFNIKILLKEQRHIDYTIMGRKP